MRVFLVRRVLLGISLLALGAFRADAQAAIDELDTGPSAAPTAMRALWSSAPIVDVDPNEPGSRSAGLQEALGRCNGGAGGCILQLRANTTYRLTQHSTWTSSTGGVEPLTAFHTNGADDVWLRGHGDSSVITYTQVGNGPDRLIRNFMLTANYGSHRVLFSDFHVERIDQCTVDCQDYAMVFAMLGNVTDIAIDRVSVRSTQLAHDSGYAGRNIFMVFPIAYPVPSPETTPKRVVVQNSRFSMSSSGIHGNNCDDCRFVANHFDVAGAPDDADGATVRAFTIFRGKRYLIAKNAMDLAMDGRTSTNYTGCFKLHGDQTIPPGVPQSQRINEDAVVVGNACTGLRQPSAYAVWFEGYRNANVTGNHFYAGQCSNDPLVSCQTREDCGTNPALQCLAAPSSAVYFEDKQWENANSNQGNAFRSNRFARGTNCAIRIDASPLDPNSQTGNLFEANSYHLTTIVNQGFCGTGAAKRFQNTIQGETLVSGANPPPSDPLAGAFVLSDSRCDDPALNTLPIESSAIVYLAASFTKVVGSATGFGTLRDSVRIDYESESPETVVENGATGKLTSWAGSRVCITIDDPAASNGGRDTLVDGANAPVCSFVERCSVTGSVTPGTRELTPRGTASAKCSGDDLHGALSSQQVASILTAFPAGNACGVKLGTRQPGRISSLGIVLQQESSARVAP